MKLQKDKKIEKLQNRTFSAVDQNDWKRNNQSQREKNTHRILWKRLWESMRRLQKNECVEDEMVKRRQW